LEKKVIADRPVDYGADRFKKNKKNITIMKKKRKKKEPQRLQAIHSENYIVLINLFIHT
jgi:hypothetical protein